ncbi:MAG: hypothetical protein H0X33_14430 [Taibaiella sp.]|nr:hypothetical protein [Taibaiella sp.]
MAKQQIDFALTAIDQQHDDITIAAGDFVLAESTLQHGKQLIYNDKGAFKENPTIGVGVYGYLDDEDGLQNLIRDTVKEFNRDGMHVDSAEIDASGMLNVIAHYPD